MLDKDIDFFKREEEIDKGEIRSMFNSQAYHSNYYYLCKKYCDEDEIKKKEVSKINEK